MMLVELSRCADWWEFWAAPAFLGGDTVAHELSSRQDVRGVGPHTYGTGMHPLPFPSVVVAGVPGIFASITCCEDRP